MRAQGLRPGAGQGVREGLRLTPRPARIAVLTVLLLLLLLLPGPALASDTLLVRRGRDAVDCPGTEKLVAMIRSLTPRGPAAAGAASSPGDGRIEVEFVRDASRYRAELRMAGARSGTRTLEYPSASCAPMAEATALAIAVLVDPDLSVPPEAKPPEPAAPAPVVAPPVPEPARRAPPPLETPARETLVLAGAGVAAGIVRHAAPVVMAQVGVSRDRFSGHVAATAIPPQRLALPPGAVDVWLAAASVGGCYAPFGSSSWQLGGCAALHAGALRGSGSGVSDASAVLRAWFAADLHLLARGSIRRVFGWFAQVGVVVPLARESFGIAGAGTAYEALFAGFVGVIGPALTFR